MGDEDRAQKSGIRSYLARPYKESNLKWTVQQVVRSTDIDIAEVDHDLLTLSDDEQFIQPRQTMPEMYLRSAKQSSRLKAASNAGVTSRSQSLSDQFSPDQTSPD